MDYGTNIVFFQINFLSANILFQRTNSPPSNPSSKKLSLKKKEKSVNLIQSAIPLVA